MRASLLLAALVIVSGCSPQTVHRLEAPEAERETGIWSDGWHIRSASASGVDAEAAYVRSLREDHTMWVRVTNTSSEVIDVNPSTFESVSYTTFAQIAERPEDGVRVNARDPEHELLEVDLRASRDAARGRTLQGFAVASAVVTTAAVAADPPDSDEEIVTVAIAYDDAAHTAREGAWTIADARAEQADGRRYWEDVLRRTTLYPGESVEGVVHVPIDPRARGVVFEIVAGETRVPFEYVQRNIRP